MQRNHNIVIRLTKSELEKIKSKAEALGMTISSFVRFIILNAKLTTDFLQ